MLINFSQDPIAVFHKLWLRNHIFQKSIDYTHSTKYILFYQLTKTNYIVSS